MSDRSLPRLWFERPVIGTLQASVAERCTVLGPGTEDEPFNGVTTAQAAIAGSARYDDAFMDLAPELTVISRMGIGVDSVDVAAATRRGIVVCNAPEGPTVSTAEHAVTLMLAVAKGVRRAQAAVETGKALRYYVGHRGIELEGKVLGLVGYGRIARHVARIARGIGMDVVAFDPYVDATTTGDVSFVASLHELLGVADVVSVHVPLTDDSRGMIGRDEFAAMKPGTVFINTARGGVVDQDALLAALEAGRLFGAGLDVTDPEPLPADHPLAGRSDVIVTPHIASGTIEGKVRMLQMAVDQAIDVVEGRRPPHIVNPEVWEHRAHGPAAGVGA